MASREEYDGIAESYVEGLRKLTASRAFTAETERGRRGTAGTVLTAEQLTEQAERLSDLSDELRSAAEDKLRSEDPQLKSEAAVQLLAKANGDMEAALFLFQAAQDEKAGVLGHPASGAAERTAPGTDGKLSDYQKVLLGRFRGAAAPEVRGVERGTGGGTKEAAKVREAVELTLFEISDSASKAGQSTFEGLLSLGVGGIIGEAVGMLGANVAQQLGIAGKLQGLFDYFRGFVARAYDTVISLLGPQLAKQVGGYVTKWWEEWKGKKLFKTVIEELYDTDATKQHVAKKLADSKAAEEEFSEAAARVERLAEDYKTQVRLAEKLLAAFKYVANAAAAALPAPAGVLVAGAVFIALCGYIVLVGADYVDAQSVASLGRLPGVRDVIESSL